MPQNCSRFQKRFQELWPVPRDDVRRGVVAYVVRQGHRAGWEGCVLGWTEIYLHPVAIKETPHKDPQPSNPPDKGEKIRAKLVEIAASPVQFSAFRTKDKRVRGNLPKTPRTFNRHHLEGNSSEAGTHH